MENRVAIYQDACRRGMDWMLQYVRGDGAIGPVEERLFYYRVPWVLALMGEQGSSERKCFSRELDYGQEGSGPQCAKQ